MISDSQFPRTAAVTHALTPFTRFFETYFATRETLGPDLIADFTLGNPHDMPMKEYVDVLQRSMAPQDKDWFAYKMSEPRSQSIVAESLRSRTGLAFDPEDIAMTTGGFSAISSALYTVTSPGDEVIFSTPPWWNYEPIAVGYDLVPVKVSINRNTFDLDLAAIEKAITPRTRVIIVNSPHNPTGKIYPPDTLKHLSELLADASRNNGREIYLLSDEAYNRIIFDGNEFHTPALYYDNTFIAYSYGKQLLTPGQRIGYLAMPPGMANRVELRKHIFAAQAVCGFSFPNALLQHAIEDLDKLLIDVERLQRKRDRLVNALTRMGYSVAVPEGTFYMMSMSPWEHDWAFVDLLSRNGVLVLPGSACELPGHFRISLTANEDMIERSLPVFARVIEHAKGQRVVV
jgi:aspartate aminotransferase